MQKPGDLFGVATIGFVYVGFMIVNYLMISNGLRMFVIVFDNVSDRNLIRMCLLLVFPQGFQTEKRSLALGTINMTNCPMLVMNRHILD